MALLVKNSSQFTSIMKTDSYSYEDFLWLPKFSYYICGYEILEAKMTRRRILMQLFHWTCVVSHVCCVVTMLKRLIEWDNIGNDFLLIARYTMQFTYVINSNIKYVVVLQKQAIRRLNGKLAALYPESKQARIDYSVNDHYWPRPLRVFVAVYCISSVLVIGQPVLMSVFIYIRTNHYPYLHFYPHYTLDPQQDPLWKYFAINIVEWLHSDLMIVSNLSTDLWLVHFEMQICMHLDYIARSLENYQPHWTRDSIDLKFISQLVDRHDQLLNLQEDINRIFGGSLLLNLLTTAMLFCNMAVCAQIQGLSLDGITLAGFMITTSSQLYLVCCYGEMVQLFSSNISHAAYNNNWSDATSAYKKSLVNIILRAQRPAELSAMGYMRISLNTFKEVGRH
ncbi:GH19037 [Drosophila grimshawi]|uniref:Odorant receptor n=1 Tax=Drosophila grimshawi TaxID=7222 RepID=B4JI61_DROGR|nr:GH19037 [Drosophila grimshawi]